MVDVSIIIVSYNTARLLEDCISSIVEKTKDISYEIIVVDNHSHDLSVELIRKKFDWVKIIVSEENLGFGRANNLGIEIAAGRNVFFLNSDTLLVNNAIKILSDYLDQNEKVGICGGNLYDVHEKPAHSFTRIFPGIAYELNYLTLNVFSKLFFGKNLYFNYSGKNIKVARVSGADMMIPKRVLDKTGGFDPGFFLYSEETDLAFRITKSGYRVVSVYAARIIHLEGQSCTFNQLKTRWGLISRHLFLRKRYASGCLIGICDFFHYAVVGILWCRAFLKGNRSECESQAYVLRNLHKSGKMNYK